MTTHKCMACGITKPLVEFYRNRSKASGYHAHCKDCMKRAVKEHQASVWGRELKRIRDRRYREEQRPWASAEHDRKRYANGRVLTPPDAAKLKARRFVHELIRLGKVTRPTGCQQCGRRHKMIEAHHPCYDMPDIFIFLCRPCHGRQHRVTQFAPAQ